MKHLKTLEEQSIFILREAYSQIPNLTMLWSIGKDSTVLLWLARKAFLGRVPFPILHIDTDFKIPEMISYRNQIAKDWNLELLIGRNSKALLQKRTYPDGLLSRTDCCKTLKTEAFKNAIDGSERYFYNSKTNQVVPDLSKKTFQGVILGIRADEEGSRSKERFFSPRINGNTWEPENQPPEFWNQFAVNIPIHTHIRIHPLLSWTEVNIWEYILLHNIPTVSLYYDNGKGQRYRSLGCYPCTKPIFSTSKNAEEIVSELTTGSLAKVAERSGRAQDEEDEGGLETLRRGGYM